MALYRKVTSEYLRCFVCDGYITGKCIPLLLGVTPYSKTELPTKIGQLMGDGFMVVVSAHDNLCKRCTSLINQLDRLEVDLKSVKTALTNYLRAKYQLDEQDLLTNCDETSTITNIKEESLKSEKTQGFSELCVKGKNPAVVELKDKCEDFVGEVQKSTEKPKDFKAEITLDERCGQRKPTNPVTNFRDNIVLVDDKEGKNSCDLGIVSAENRCKDSCFGRQLERGSEAANSINTRITENVKVSSGGSIPDHQTRLYVCCSCSLRFPTDLLLLQHEKTCEVCVTSTGKEENTLALGITGNASCDTQQESCSSNVNYPSKISCDSQSSNGSAQKRDTFKSVKCSDENDQQINDILHETKTCVPSDKPEQYLCVDSVTLCKPDLFETRSNIDINLDMRSASNENKVLTHLQSKNPKSTDEAKEASEEHCKKKVKKNKIPSGAGSSKKDHLHDIDRYQSQDLHNLKASTLLHREEAETSHCKHCNKLFSSESKLHDHGKMCLKNLNCKLCKKCFLNVTDIQKHYHEEHKQYKTVYNCRHCSVPFLTRHSCQIHEREHSELSLCCEECGEIFSRAKQLKYHKDTFHRDSHCRYCGKEIINLKTLRYHELRHARESKENFECSECKKIFKTKTGLRHHFAAHTGQYKFYCDYCGRGFMSKLLMEDHRTKHTKEERYVCDVCGRKFRFQSTYWIHRKWHDNPYPYKCNFCGRPFRHTSLLAVHKRKHTGERPYKCPHCPLTFPVGGTLKRHIILHTGVYPYNCEICKRGFTTRHKFAVHLSNIHGDSKLLDEKSQPNEFKMVIRDEVTVKKQDNVEHIFEWQTPGDPDHVDMNFKLGDPANSEDNFEHLEGAVPCSLVSDEFLVGNVFATRVVEIVLDESSQAVAAVTVADPESNIIPDLWYQ